MRRQPWSSWTFALFLALGCSTERRSSPVDPVDSGAGPGGPAGEEREGRYRLLFRRRRLWRR